MVLATVGLGTVLVLAACVGLGAGLARIVPIPLSQASLLCLLSLMAFVLMVARVAAAYWALAQAAGFVDASAPGESGADVTTDEADSSLPSAGATLMAVATEVFKVSAPRLRPKKRRPPSPSHLH